MANKLKGAEAVLTKTKIIGISALIKDRIPKSYRANELDNKLRRERTRVEARLLHKAKLAGVLCPTVLEVREFQLVIEFLNGKRPKMNERIALEAGKLLAKLHSAGIIHGDFTPANLMETKNELCVIDFGLGFFSSDIEDMAIDVLTMLKSVNTQVHTDFLKGYSIAKDYSKVMQRLEVVKKRVRYAF
ncbi:MAG: KEOPS complex kinase/ATPase Bud32 [Candidatus Micrarchaeota archaeon]|nr:KEOPS complex kinase/ATPase Bud32 [Candidatus Micrarchaeota archaeon]